MSASDPHTPAPASQALSGTENTVLATSAGQVADARPPTGTQPAHDALARAATALSDAFPATARRSSASADDDALAAGARLGRFTILDTLGAGGMGVVHGAYDPRLDRKVALKVLRFAGPAQEQLRARLLREARAMARLTHPNVITVYDVDSSAEQSFVAMELVVGQTLRDWMNGAERLGTTGRLSSSALSEPADAAVRRSATTTEPGDGEPRDSSTARPARDWRAVLDVFSAAAAGLIAAHDVGIVHRDFKPGNVLLGDDGRVLVTDFGLARMSDDEPEEPSPAPLSTADGDRPLDSTSALARTPLTRTGAFMGTPGYMAPEQLGSHEVDARCDQFAFCVSLWEALYGRRPFPGRTLTAIVTAAVEGRLAAPPANTRVPAPLRPILERGLRATPAERWPSMRALADELMRVRHPPRRRGWLLAALLLGGIGLGVVLLWSSTRDRDAAPACAAPTQRLGDIWSAERSARIDAQLRATGSQLAGTMWPVASARIDGYVDAWSAGHVAACEATEVQRTQPAALMEKRMLCLEDRLGELDDLLALLERADGALVARVPRLVAGLPALSRCADRQALLVAQPRPADPRLAAEVDALRATLSSNRKTLWLGQPARALEVSETLVERARAVDYRPVLLEALQQYGEVLVKLERVTEAEAAYTELFERAHTHARDDLAVMAATKLIWLVGHRQRRVDEARVWQRFTAAGLERIEASDDLRGRYLNELGALHYSNGELEKALEAHRQAIAAFERWGPDGLIKLAGALSNAGADLASMKRLEEAEPYYRRALEAWNRAAGPGHPDSAATLINLGNILLEREQYPEAEEVLAEAAGIAGRGPEKNYGMLAIIHTRNCEIHRRQGQLEQALPYCQLSLEEFEKAPTFAKVYGLDALGALGQLYSQSGRHDQALATFERAVATFEPNKVPPSSRAELLASMAMSLWQAGRDRERALALAHQARSLFDPSAQASALAQLDTWLAERTGAPDAAASKP